MYSTSSSDLEINEQFKKALDLMNGSFQNIFITGKAGTGKSSLLTYFLKQNKKPIAVLAPTGVAALNVQGETIHSFFKFSPNINPEMAAKKGKQQSKNNLYKNLKTIIIDEISMVRADLLDCIDEFLQAAKNLYEPFGGVQMIFIGDLYQLPPVVIGAEKQYFSSFYKSAWFFDANVFSHHNFRIEYIELDKIYRQKDTDFIEILNAIRTNKAESDHISTINQRLGLRSDDDTICLTSTNDKANTINQERLLKLSDKSISFKAASKGDVELKQLPTEKSLGLKVGAQVMFVNNDSAGRWVNGTIGKVKHIEKNLILVEIVDGEVVEVTPHTWDIYKHDHDDQTNSLKQITVGSFTQMPVKLAWAITIHKSQGKTFSRVKIDLGAGSFASGQTYVALSRCQSLEGISLASPIRASDIQLDWRIEKFLDTLKNPNPKIVDPFEVVEDYVDDFWE